MLKPDQFTLLRSFFAEVSVSANPAFSESSDAVGASFKTDIDCDKREDGIYITRLSVSCDDEESPYHFETNAFAYIQVAQEHQGEDYSDCATAYGVQILYGMAREYLEILSGKGPWDQHLTINLGICDISAQMAAYKAKLIKEAQDGGEE